MARIATAVLLVLLVCLPCILQAQPLVIKNSKDVKVSKFPTAHLFPQTIRHRILLFQTTYWSDPKAENKPHRNSLFQGRQKVRSKRANFDLILGAEHEQNVGTDVSIEALVDLWKSEDANTRVSGSATYNQRFGADNVNGNARFGGKITLHHSD